MFLPALRDRKFCQFTRLQPREPHYVWCNKGWCLWSLRCLFRVDIAYGLLDVKRVACSHCQRKSSSRLPFSQALIAGFDRRGSLLAAEARPARLLACSTPWDNELRSYTSWRSLEDTTGKQHPARSAGIHVAVCRQSAEMVFGLSDHRSYASFSRRALHV